MAEKKQEWITVQEFAKRLSTPKKRISTQVIYNWLYQNKLEKGKDWKEEERVIKRKLILWNPKRTPKVQTRKK